MLIVQLPGAGPERHGCFSMYRAVGLTSHCELNTHPQIHQVAHYELSAQPASITCRSWKAALQKKNSQADASILWKLRCQCQQERARQPALSTDLPEGSLPLQGCLLPWQGHLYCLVPQSLAQSFRTRLCFKLSAGISSLSNPNHRSQFAFFMHMLLQALKQTEIKLFL